MKEIRDIYHYMFQFILQVYVGGVHWVHSTGRISVPRMYALFFHRLSILERATDHKCIEDCSYSKKKCG
jgi:hypothetical protein